MKMLLLLDLDITYPEDSARVLKHIDPPSIPHFDGSVRFAVEPAASTVKAYLDGETDAPPTPTSLRNALFAIEGRHHFFGDTCLCGFQSSRARSRTGHITRELAEALFGEDALRGIEAP